MKKKLLSIILTLAMMTAMMPTMAGVSFAGEVSPTIPVELVKAASSGSRIVNLSWCKVSKATKYVVYGQKCGKSFKKLKTTASTSYKVKKIKGKKLKAHKMYKFYIVAYNKSKKLAASKKIRFITAKTSGKYANARSISVNKTLLTLEAGKTAALKVTTKIYKNKRHIKTSRGAKTRYISDCPKVAKVNSAGKVTAVAKGTATIYIQDIGGLWCRTRVSVYNEAETVAPSFVSRLAVLAGGFSTTGWPLEKQGYTAVYWNDGRPGNGRYADMNLNADGKYIFLGYDTTGFYDIVTKKPRTDLVTGLLVYNGKNPPKQFVSEGKTYKPINTMGDSNGDFNQNAGGSYLYLYYTNDGAAEGEPLLTKIRARKPSDRTHSANYVKCYNPKDQSDTPSHCLCQDMNAGAGGDYIYLEADYHKHTLEDKKDEAGHPYKACTGCPYRTDPTHFYEYGGSSKPGCHEVYCVYGKETFTEPHVDADGDFRCDKCSAHFYAKADGLLFETFENVWNYALEQDHEVTIEILRTVNADYEMNKVVPLKPIDNGAKIQLKRAASADSSAVINAHGTQPFTVNNGTLSIYTDIVVKSKDLQSLASASGSSSMIRLENAKIDVQSTNADTDCAIISAENGAEAYVNNGEILIEENDSNAKTCALILTDGANAELTNGRFIGKECINAAGGSVHVKNIVVKGNFKTSSCLADCVPANYAAFVLDDSGKPVEILPYSIFEQKEYSFSKLTRLCEYTNN